MTLSVPAANTPRVSASAAAAPAASEPATMRDTGPVVDVRGDNAWSRWMVGWVSVRIRGSLSQSVVGMESRSGGASGGSPPERELGGSAQLVAGLLDGLAELGDRDRLGGGE